MCFICSETSEQLYSANNNVVIRGNGVKVHVRDENFPGNRNEEVDGLYLGHIST